MSAIFFDSLETQVSSSTPHSIKTNGSQTTREYISNGTPEGSITAVVGSTCIDTTTGVTYRKNAGSGNTGWINTDGATLHTWNLSSGMALVSQTEIKKTSATVGWNEQAYSTEGYVRGCFVTFRTASVSGTQRFMMTLNSDPTADASYTSLDYSFYVNITAGNAEVWINGASTAYTTAITTSTVLAITYDGEYVRFWADSTLVHTVSRAIGSALYLDSSFYDVGASATNIHFGPMGSATGLADGDKGDITVSSTGTVWTVDNDVITNAKLANMTSGTIKGCVSSGDPIDLTPAQARLILRKAKNALTFASTQNWDLNDGLYHTLTTTGNFTLNLPSNIVEGETAFIYAKQDGTGSRILTLASGYQTPGGTQPVLSTAANAVDRLMFFFDTSSTCTATITKDIKTI